MNEILNYVEMVLANLSALLVAAGHLALVVYHWKYFWQVVAIGLAVIASTLFIRAYRQWQRAWLSDLVEHTLSEIRRNPRTARKSQRPKFALGGFLRARRIASFRYLRATTAYVLRDFWQAFPTIYLPSMASVIAAVLLLSFVALVPHWPTHWEVLWHPLGWWIAIVADIDDKESIPRIFEGLIVVIVALIVFVAESVRGSKNSDEKRVLLQISNLWPLAVLITLAPFTFLVPPATGLTALLAIGISIIAVIAFARVLLSMLDASAGIRAQREFLKQRIRGMVMYSARERVGNKLLFDRLGAGKEIAINFTISRTWLPSGERNYVFVPAPAHGTLIDINLHELKLLATLLERRSRAKAPAPAATANIGATAGPSPRAAAATDRASQAYLLRRFREEVPQETVFSRNVAILAIPKDLAEDRALFEEIRSRVSHIFAFSDDVQPSDAFRREMESTKDRLISAIRSLSLGAIEDLKQTYLLVAEEFLTMLAELGGGYTAQQAREERGNIFTGWSEVRWLVRDVRELLIAASQTNNTDVIGTIAYLPSAIAIRALQAGDQLLYQEFLNFSSLIYHLGTEKNDPAVRAFMMDRSWRYLRELAEYYVQPLLSEEDDDDD